MILKSKPFWKSSTLWINVLGIIVIALDLVVKSNLIPDPDVVAIIVAVLNIINRFRGQGGLVTPLSLR